jgi:hypothetical protein
MFHNVPFIKKLTVLEENLYSQWKLFIMGYEINGPNDVT